MMVGAISTVDNGPVRSVSKGIFIPYRGVLVMPFWQPKPTDTPTKPHYTDRESHGSEQSFYFILFPQHLFSQQSNEIKSSNELGTQGEWSEEIGTRFFFFFWGGRGGGGVRGVGRMKLRFGVTLRT